MLSSLSAKEGLLGEKTSGGWCWESYLHKIRKLSFSLSSLFSRNQFAFSKSTLKMSGEATFYCIGKFLMKTRFVRRNDFPNGFSHIFPNCLFIRCCFASLWSLSPKTFFFSKSCIQTKCKLNFYLPCLIFWMIKNLCYHSVDYEWRLSIRKKLSFVWEIELGNTHSCAVTISTRKHIFIVINYLNE